MLTTRTRTLTIAVAAAVAAALVPGTASAAPQVTGEFDVSKKPQQLTLGPDGNVWVLIGSDIAKVQPDGTVTEYDPADLNGGIGITAGPDGNLWVTDTKLVVRIPPGDPNAAKKFTADDLPSAQGITTGPDGNLYAATTGAVLRITPGDPPTYKRFPIDGMSPRGIASSGGLIWVADFFYDGFMAGAVHSLALDGTAKHYEVKGSPQGIAGGPGGQIAYANQGAPQHVGRITPGGEAQKSFYDNGTDPFGMTFGPDGNYWYAEFGVDRIGRLTPGGQVTDFSVSAGSGPRYITAGAGNTVWVSLEKTNKIARVSGVVPETTTTTTPPRDTVAPAISGFSLSSKAFRAGAKTKLRYKLSEAATARFTVQRVAKRKGKRHLRHAGGFSRPATAGRNVIAFNGRIGRRALKPGRYVVAMTATDAAGNVSTARRAAFKILARPKARGRR